MQVELQPDPSHFGQRIHEPASRRCVGDILGPFEDTSVDDIEVVGVEAVAGERVGVGVEESEFDVGLVGWVGDRVASSEGFHTRDDLIGGQRSRFDAVILCNTDPSLLEMNGIAVAPSDPVLHQVVADGREPLPVQSFQLARAVLPADIEVRHGVPDDPAGIGMGPQLVVGIVHRRVGGAESSRPERLVMSDVPFACRIAGDHLPEVMGIAAEPEVEDAAGAVGEREIGGGADLTRFRDMRVQISLEDRCGRYRGIDLQSEKSMNPDDGKQMLAGVTGDDGGSAESEEIGAVLWIGLVVGGSGDVASVESVLEDLFVGADARVGDMKFGDLVKRRIAVMLDDRGEFKPGIP